MVKSLELEVQSAMKDEHVIEMLDSVPFGSLSKEQLTVVESHGQVCVSCSNAYRTAILASAVMKERLQSAVEPPPFFETRVLAALREQQAVENVPALVRLWKSAGALVSSMAVATVALAAFSFAVPSALTPVSDQTASAYSAESVILDQSGDDQMTYEQVLSTMYSDDDEAK
jgi:hypothetical protein